VAEERNPVNASAGTAAIKSEIERTRVEMSETIGEIQDRLRPDHLLQQAKDGVREAAAGKVRDIMSSAGEKASVAANRARGAGGYLTDYAKAHPVRIAITIGAVAAFWVMRSRNESDMWYDGSTESWDDTDADSFERRSLRSRVGKVASKAGEYASTAKQAAGEYASTAKQAVGEYASTAREAAGEYATSAAQTAAEYAAAARENARYASQRARRAASTADDWVRENPLAAGAIALAVGAAIAAMLPQSELENRAMGGTRDQAWERARRAAAELKENVTKKVETVAENLVSESVMGAGTGTGSPTEPMGRA
jgi:ElaB/YqjD/DUF883 family membrane-anchored ribosome-binding protein